MCIMSPAASTQAHLRMDLLARFGRKGKTLLRRKTRTLVHPRGHGGGRGSLREGRKQHKAEPEHLP